MYSIIVSFSGLVNRPHAITWNSNEKRIQFLGNGGVAKSERDKHLRFSYKTFGLLDDAFWKSHLECFSGGTR